jgi:hypothetical protein
MSGPPPCATSGRPAAGGDAVAIINAPYKQPWIALIGGSPIPRDRCGLVFGNTDAGLIRDREVELSGHVTLLGRASPPSDGLHHVLRDTIASGVLPAEGELGRRVALLRRLTQRRPFRIIRQQGAFSRRPERRPSHVVERRGGRAARTEHADDHNREDHRRPER